MTTHTTIEDAMAATASERQLEREEAAFTEAAAADERMADHAKKSFADWLLISIGLQQLQQRAMREAGVNAPFSPRYTKVYASLKKTHPWAGHYDKTATAHCVWLADNIGPVVRWRDAQNEHKKKLWVTPRAVKENYQREMRDVHTIKPANAPPTAMQELRARVTALQEENDRLRTPRNRVGPMFGNKNADAAADEIGDSGYAPPFLRRLSASLARRADRDEAFDRQTAKKGKKP
jgi:hypothetical protein